MSNGLQVVSLFATPIVLIDLPDAAERNFADDGLLELGISEHAFRERGFNEGGANGIDTNILLTQFPGQRLGHAFDRVLARAIDGAPGRAHMTHL